MKILTLAELLVVHRRRAVHERIGYFRDHVSGPNLRCGYHDAMDAELVCFAAPLDELESERYTFQTGK